MRCVTILVAVAVFVPITGMASDDGCSPKNVTKHCFASTAQYELMMLDANTRLELSKAELGQQSYDGMLSTLGDQRRASIQRVEAIYKSLGKRFPKTAPAARKFYIEWQAAMAGLTPNANDSKFSLSARQTKLTADVEKAALDLTTD